MSSTILSVDTMPCGLRHIIKRATVGEPWTEFYTAPEPGDQWVLRPYPARGRGWEPVDQWALAHPTEGFRVVTLREGIRFLRSRLG